MVEETQSDFTSKILSLDAADDYVGLVEYFNENVPSPDILTFTVYRLVTAHRFRTAYLLAGPLVKAGVQNPVVYFIQAIGGFLNGNSGDEDNGKRALQLLIDAAAPGVAATIYKDIVHPAISSIIIGDASLVSDHGRALRILEIIKAALPAFRQIFDWDSPGETIDIVELAARGRSKSKLISFRSPPNGAPRVARRVIMAGRERVFPQSPTSRLYEAGPRAVASMNDYGWRATFLPLNMANYVHDFANIVTACESEKADLLILDDLCITIPQALALRTTMIQRLRQTLPRLKVVSLHHDPWDIASEILIKSAEPVDAVWAQFPSMPVWQHPGLSNKIMYVPFPHAGQSGIPTTPMTDRMTFIGGVFGYNWHRIFWLAGVDKGLPIDFFRSTHEADGLSVVDSYAAYMTRVESVGCSINFSMRPDLSQVMTGRNFETILAGALLVQEQTPDMDYYFVSGEHYLNFESVPDLRSIARFIADKTEQAEEVRRQGNAFARERYSDGKLTGYMDAQLFY